MLTPFDEVVDYINQNGFHNHRLEAHSDTVSRGILRDLGERCETLRDDIDNVNPPHVPRPNSLGIDIDREYESMLRQICKAYSARWHL